MKTIQTKYGAMHLYDSIEELDEFTHESCADWLHFNDPNGCYFAQDQMDEFGFVADLSDMKKLILTQSEE
jgi:hypothetical protein